MMMMMWWSTLAVRLSRHGRWWWWHGRGYIILGTLLFHIVTEELGQGTATRGIYKAGALAAVHIRAGKTLEEKLVLIMFIRSFPVQYVPQIALGQVAVAVPSIAFRMTVLLTDFTGPMSFRFIAAQISCGCGIMNTPLTYLH